MAHEHQRWDRDDSLEFRCINIAGMSETIERYRVAENADYETALKALCKDPATATNWSAPSLDFIKGGGLDVATKPQLDGPGGLDMESIMLYNSWDFSQTDRQRY